MENKLIEVVETIPTLIKNTHFNVTLEGWPAAVTAIAICCSSVAAFAIKVVCDSDAEETYATHKAA